MPLGAARAAIIRAKAAAAYGLIDFIDTNTERHYTMAQLDGPTLSGTTGWATFFFARIDDNTGDFFQYILSAGGVPGSTSSINVWMLEDGVGANAGKWSCNAEDDAGVGTANVVGANIYGGDGIERLLVLQSTTSAVQLYVCPVGGSAVQEINSATALGALTPDTDWFFGCRSDTDVDRFYEEHAGGLGIADRDLTVAEIEAIAGGADPTSELGADCTHFWPFLNGAVATETDTVSSIDLTRQGTGWS